MSIDQTDFILYSNKIHRQNVRFIWPVIRIMTPVPSVRLHISSSRVLAPYLSPRLTIAYPMLLILALWLF
jgi:hypothetical protein